jgi:hypothetical protein
MDLFLAGCQGVGLALAAGGLAGSIAGAWPSAAAARTFMAAVAAVGGGLLFGASLATADHPAWPGWPVGALLSLFAYVVVASVVAGALGRQGEGGSAAAVAGTAALVSLALAGLSLLVPPISLLALLALGWLALTRRRRAARKYEGLRVLR